MQEYLSNAGKTRQDDATKDAYFQNLNKEYMQIDRAYKNLMKEQVNCQNQIDKIEPFINPDMKTTFVGFNGADFNNSYNGFITEKQGNAVENFGGVCGITGDCGMTNQQTGSSLGEADGINEFKANGWCSTGGNYEDNGGTDEKGRCAFLNSKGLTFEHIEGCRNNQKEISLEDIAQRLYNGESAGLALKGQDLSQPDIASRKFNFRKSTDDRYNANHFVVIAGFSFNKAGKIVGVWVNDTGGCSGDKVNRVFIDSAKFYKMQKNTEGFAVEFSKKR